MTEYLQPTKESVREDFYQTMLLKYKREILNKEKLIKAKEEREIEKILNLKNQRSLKDKKGIFATKERINNTYTSWINKSSLPKSNLAYQVKDGNLVLDGGNEAVSDISNLSDYVTKDEEGQTQLNLEKTRKELKKKIKEGAERYKEAKKGAETAKVAKTGTEVAKVAKVGAEGAKATKVAKTAKTLKTVFNVSKVVTLGAAVETIFISLIVTVIIWWVQIIGAHLIKNKYIPRMSGWDWAGFGFLVVPLIVIQAIPLIILIGIVSLDVWALSYVIDFLEMFMSAPGGVIGIIGTLI